MHAGYKAGEEMGHPIAGTLLGQEGAAGARSKWDNSVDIGDVYTGKNLLKRGIQGGVLGAAVGALDPEIGIPELAAASAAGTAAISPGVNYGLGKLFGSQTPNNRKF
jgi:hypothetical protein